MTLPSYIASSNANSNVPGVSSTRTFNRPGTGWTAGNTALIGIWRGTPAGNEAFSSVPTGWVQLAQVQLGSSGDWITVYRKVLVTADNSTASYTFTWTTSVYNEIVGCAFLDTDQTTPENQVATQSNTSSTTITCPAVTPTVANTLLVCFGAYDNDTSYTSNTGMTERLDFGGWAMTVATETGPASGVSSGTNTFTALGGAFVSAGVTIALQEVQATGVTGVSAGHAGGHGADNGGSTRAAGVVGSAGAHGATAAAQTRAATSAGHAGAHGASAGVSVRTGTSAGHAGAHGAAVGGSARTATSEGHAGAHGATLGAPTGCVTPTWIAAGPQMEIDTTAEFIIWPTHQINDIALLFVETIGGATASLNTPAGFVELPNSPQTTGTAGVGTKLSVYWCRATSTSMAAPEMAAGTNHQTGIIHIFRGCPTTGNPWDTTGGGVKAAASTTTTTTGITTSSGNCLIVEAQTSEVDTAAAFTSNRVNANLANLTERSDGGTALGNGGGICVTTGELATAGASGATVYTVGSTRAAFFTIALKCASASGVTGVSAGSAGGHGASVGTKSASGNSQGHAGVAGQTAGAQGGARSSAGHAGAHGSSSGVANRTGASRGSAGAHGVSGGVSGRAASSQGHAGAHGASTPGEIARTGTSAGHAGGHGESSAVPIPPVIIPPEENFDECESDFLLAAVVIWPPGVAREAPVLVGTSGQVLSGCDAPIGTVKGWEI